jgi:hypothetical protein
LSPGGSGYLTQIQNEIGLTKHEIGLQNIKLVCKT